SRDNFMLSISRQIGASVVARIEEQYVFVVGIDREHRVHQRAGESAEPAPVAPRSSVDPDLHRSGLDEDSDLASGARAFVNGIGYFDGAKPVNSVGASGGQTGNPARKVLHFLGQRIDRIRLPSEKFLPDVDRGIKAK